MYMLKTVFTNSCSFEEVPVGALLALCVFRVIILLFPLLGQDLCPLVHDTSDLSKKVFLVCFS